MGFFCSQGQVVTDPDKTELIREFTAAPVTCQFDEDLIKIEGTINQMSNMGIFATQGQVTPKWRI